jgi:hypothetical protein
MHTAVIALTCVAFWTSREVEARCPVDGERFRATRVEITNTWGGVDYDRCPHAYYGVPLQFRVWTCPRCRFTASPEDFEHIRPEPHEGRALTDEQKRAIREGLANATGVPPGARQAQIPADVKFDLWAQTNRILGEPRHKIGMAYLWAAWYHRQTGALRLRYFDEFDRLWERYRLNVGPLDYRRMGIWNRTDYDLAKAREIEQAVAADRHRGVDRVIALYIAGYLYRKHGENEDALRVLRSIEEEARANSPIHDNLTAMLASIERERENQRRALEEYRAGLETLEPEAQAEVWYMLGELQRRLGRPEEAVAAFEQVGQIQQANEWTRYWAARQRAAIRGEPLPDPPRPPETPRTDR